MSSIRPLATITLLACVGVILYVKIDEKEPSLPPGMELPPGFDAAEGDWSAPPTFGEPLEIAEPIEFTGAPEPELDQAPSWTPPSMDGAGMQTADAYEPSTAPTATAPNSVEPDSLDYGSNGYPAGEFNSAEQYSPQASNAPSAAQPGGSLPGMPPNASLTPPLPVDPSPPFAAAPGEDLGVGGDYRSTSSEPTETTPSIPDLPDLPAFSDTTAEATSPYGTTAGPTTDAPPSSDYNASYDAASGAGAADEDVLPTPPFANGQGAFSSLYSTARLEVQAALDRGDLSQALLKLSDWYGDPSLTPEQRVDVENLLSQLAGSVIYEGPPAHRIEPPYRVGADETLMQIGEKFDVPWQLLAKINGISDPQQLQPGQVLKVVRGPFSAVVDLSERQLTLMLDRRYAGRFPIEIAPQTTLEEGQWKVDQKLLTPSGAGMYGSMAGSGEDRSLVLSNLTSPTSEPAVVRGPGNADPAAVQTRGRAIRLQSTDVEDIFDILSVGSRVIIRR
ncbi:MAG: LysM peptidoglycan-binding domain-containing protein [Planctomycetales bacterium]|nr:LysM peptidoglycan-binding domain-containing protein [Planctomycetales bacterium]